MYAQRLRHQLLQPRLHRNYSRTNFFVRNEHPALLQILHGKITFAKKETAAFKAAVSFKRTIHWLFYEFLSGFFRRHRGDFVRTRTELKRAHASYKTYKTQNKYGKIFHTTKLSTYLKIMF